MPYYHPELIPNGERHGGRYGNPAHFVPPHPDTWRQVYGTPSPALMSAHNRLWHTILTHPNPLEAINQCMELLTDGNEEFPRPQNEVEEEQNGREGGQQGGHVYAPEPGEYGGMPPQGPPPPYQPQGGMPDYYRDLYRPGGRVGGMMAGGAMAGGGVPAGLQNLMPPQYPGAGGGFPHAPLPYGGRR